MPTAPEQKPRFVTIHTVKEALLKACAYLERANEIITELEPANAEDDGPNIQYAIQTWRELAAHVDKHHHSVFWLRNDRINKLNETRARKRKIARINKTKKRRR